MTGPGQLDIATTLGALALIDQPTTSAQLDTLRLRVANESGIHARPAADLAKIFNQLLIDHEIEATVKYGDESAPAHSVMSLIILGAGKGSELEISFSRNGIFSLVPDLVNRLLIEVKAHDDDFMQQ